MNSVSRLRFTASGDEGVTARICLDQGEIVVHGSSTYSTPNMALNDFSAVITPGSCRNFFASTAHVNGARCNQNSQQTNQTTLYLTIQGKSTTQSQYSITSSFGNAFGNNVFYVVKFYHQVLPAGGCTLSLEILSCAGGCKEKQGYRELLWDIKKGGRKLHGVFSHDLAWVKL